MARTVNTLGTHRLDMIYSGAKLDVGGSTFRMCRRTFSLRHRGRIHDVAVARAPSKV